MLYVPPRMKPPILALKQVRLADGQKMLFDGVDLGLEPRSRAALVGRNGAGKTTLLKVLAGLIEADDGERVVKPGTRVVIVPQEPEITGETVLDYATAGGAEDYQAQAALELFGIDWQKSAKGLSGGEIRRVALARALAEDPDILLLDEPTNHLDILAIETLEQELASSRAAMLIISHDRAFLERTTGRCFWLEHRKIRRLDKGFGAFDEWVDQVLAAEAEETRRIEKKLEQEEYWLQRGVTGRRARNEGRRRALMDLRQVRIERMGEARGEMNIGVESSGLSGKRVVEARGLSKSYGERTLLKSFSTRILRGDRVAIVGPNGAGKTTLVKLLLGDVEPDAGSVKLGANLEVAYIDQARVELRPDMMLRDVLTPLGGDQVMVRGNPRHVISYAKDFLFTDAQIRQPVKSLSGGERNRLLLARALATPANLLVLDEPTNDLDMDTLDLLEEVLADYEGTLILVSHDRDFVDRLATSTIALNGHGDVVETPGGWQDFLRQNPGFFHAVNSSPPSAKTQPTYIEPTPKMQAKLTYKDQRRLEELERAIADLPGRIAALEAQMADPALYTRDPAKFRATNALLDERRTELVRSEEEWLGLEERREALEVSR